MENPFGESAETQEISTFSGNSGGNLNGFGLLNFQAGHKPVKLLPGEDFGFLLTPRPLVSAMRIQAFVDQYKTIRLMDQCLNSVTTFPAKKIQGTSADIFMQEIHTEKMPVDKSFDKMRFVEEHLNGLSGAEIAFVASEAAYNSIRRTIDMRDAFSGKTIELSEENTVIEIDFMNAVMTLKNRKKRADTAKFRYNL